MSTDVVSDESSSSENTTTCNVDSKKEQALQVTVIPPVDPFDDFPDGGLRAWLVVFGTVCSTFSTFGYVNAWGIFQAYYEQTLLRDSSPSNIAWIGSIQYALSFAPGIFVGRLFDIGHFKVPTFFASATLVIMTFLVGQCTRYWQFLLCQGFGTGLASGIAFGPVYSVIAHWFKRRRGLAMGFMGFGSSIGGTVLSITAHNLIPAVGFPWTMRIIGFILLVTLGVGHLTMKRRLPPSRASGGLFNFHIFKTMAYSIWCISGFFAFLGMYTALTYIDVSATSAGISADFSFYLIAIANASSGVGRFTGGWLADRTGSVNIMAPMTTIAAILTYAWPFARSQASITVVAILYGYAIGAYVCLFATPLIAMGALEDVGRRSGMLMSIIAMGALAGPPISGAINNATRGFAAVGYYAGSTMLFAVLLMIVTRYLVLRRVWGKF